MNRQKIIHETNPALDLIRTRIPEGKPDWTENIAFSMHDPEAGISLYAHLGRMQPDRSIWEGLSLIFLANGEVLVNRSLGVSVTEARNKEYHFRPVIPIKSWQYSFDGVAQRVQPKVLTSRPVADEPFEAVSYELVFEAVQPVFNMHDSNLNSERMHLEHGGIFKGAFFVGGKKIDVNATGYRDHSVSRRTFTTLDTETWANCTFPSGRVFSMLEVSRGNQQILEGQVYQDGEMQLAKPLAVPVLSDSSGSPHSGYINLQVASEIIEIRWDTVQPCFVPFNLLRPVGMRPGLDLSDSDSMVVVQCPTMYRWDGELGYGWLERTRPLKALS